MSGAVDKILTSGLQYFEQYHKLNPVDIKINDIKIILSLSKHGKHRQRLHHCYLVLHLVKQPT